MADILEFKPSQLSLIVVRIRDTNMNAVATTLHSKLSKSAGKFLKGAAIVIEPLCELTSVHIAQLIELLRQYEMTPIGIRTQTVHLIEYAELSGLAVFKNDVHGASREGVSLPQASSNNEDDDNYDDNQESTDKTISTAKQILNLRSGQLEKYMTGDVLVSGTINSGAELYAGGNITVLRSVRGRIHAGAMGNRSAKIIAKDFNPELVSISGVFLLSDDIPRIAKQGWVEVTLDQQSLKFHSLD